MGAVGPKQTYKQTNKQTSEPTHLRMLFRRGIHCARYNLRTPSSNVAAIHFCRHQTTHKPVFEEH